MLIIQPEKVYDVDVEVYHVDLLAYDVDVQVYDVVDLTAQKKEHILCRKITCIHITISTFTSRLIKFTSTKKK